MHQQLLESIKNQDIQQITRLLAQGLDVNFTNLRFPKPALMLAIATPAPLNNHIAHLLLAAGADVRKTDQHGYTPLHYATSDLNIALMSQLIELGADVNAEAGEDGWTPITCFGSDEFENTPSDESLVLSTVSLLLERGANPIGSCTSALHWVVDLNFLRVAQKLIDTDKDIINSVDASGYTAMMNAAMSAKLQPMMQCLHQNGADIHIQNNYGEDAFDIATQHGNLLGMDYLVKYCGVDIHRQFDGGDTYLHRMARHTNMDGLRFFIDHGLSVHTKNNKGMTIFDLENEFNHMIKRNLKTLLAYERRKQVYTALHANQEVPLGDKPVYPVPMQDILSYLSLKEFGFFTTASKFPHFPQPSSDNDWISDEAFAMLLAQTDNCSNGLELISDDAFTVLMAQVGDHSDEETDIEPPSKMQRLG